MQLTKMLGICYNHMQPHPPQKVFSGVGQPSLCTFGWQLQTWFPTVETGIPCLCYIADGKTIILYFGDHFFSISLLEYKFLSFLVTYKYIFNSHTKIKYIDHIAQTSLTYCYCLHYYLSFCFSVIWKGLDLAHFIWAYFDQFNAHLNSN